MRTLASTAVTFITAACYTYAPATVETVPVGARVRGLLSTEAQVTLEDSLGLELRTLNGTLVERGDQQLVFTVRSTGSAPSPGFATLYQRVVLAPRDVLRVDVRRIDKARTIALLGAVTAVATFAIIEGWHSNPGDPGGGNGGGNELRVPIWFRLGLR